MLPVATKTPVSRAAETESVVTAKKPSGSAASSTNVLYFVIAFIVLLVGGLVFLLLPGEPTVDPIVKNNDGAGSAQIPGNVEAAQPGDETPGTQFAEPDRLRSAVDEPRRTKEKETKPRTPVDPPPASEVSRLVDLVWKSSYLADMDATLESPLNGSVEKDRLEGFAWINSIQQPIAVFAVDQGLKIEGQDDVIKVDWDQPNSDEVKLFEDQIAIRFDDRWLVLLKR